MGHGTFPREHRNPAELPPHLPALDHTELFEQGCLICFQIQGKLPLFHLAFLMIHKTLLKAQAAADREKFQLVKRS